MDREFMLSDTEKMQRLNSIGIFTEPVIMALVPLQFGDPNRSIHYGVTTIMSVDEAYRKYYGYSINKQDQFNK